MSTDDESIGPVRVYDKRLFTTDGELRDEQREGSDPKPLEKPEEETTSSSENRGTQSETESGAADNDPPGTLFSGFIESLVVSAYVNLGIIQNPLQSDTSVNLDGARQMIDILEVLKEKTMGNLTEAEDAFLKNHLAELKLAWVRLAKGL